MANAIEKIVEDKKNGKAMIHLNLSSEQVGKVELILEEGEKAQRVGKLSKELWWNYR